MLRTISQQWRALSNVTLGLILIINLLFVIFYVLESSSNVINLKYKEAEVTIELLGIFQAFFSFLVMMAYIMRYHGRIYETYLE